LSLNYKIIYKKGSDNTTVDALSRRTLDAESYYTLSVSQPKWLDKISTSYDQDEFTQDVIAKLALDSETVPHFSWNSGLLRYKNRIWMGADLAL
jgi:hypothetical protein